MSALELEYGKNKELPVVGKLINSYRDLLAMLWFVKLYIK